MINQRVFRALIIIIFSFVHLISFSQKTSLTGKAPAYAGETIDFFVYSDYITNSESQVASCSVGPEGNFSVSFDLDETQKMLVPLGVYEAYIYLQPNTHYEIKLPPKQEKTTEERLNPFFNPVQLHVGIIHASRDGEKLSRASELNTVINIFDNLYKHKKNQMNQENYDGDSLKIKPEEIFQELDQEFTNVLIPFFNHYKKFQYGLLEYNYAMNKNEIIRNYFLNYPVLYNNPGYMNLFNKIFERYFRDLYKYESNQEIIRTILYEKSYSKLKKELQNTALNHKENLVEMVILKQLHDQFYRGDYSRQALVRIIDSLYFNTTNPEHKYIAQNIREKITQLLPGFAPPDFQLYDKDSNLVSMEDFGQKYVLLNFCSYESFGCIRDFELLKDIQKRLQPFFQIVTISVDRNFEAAIYYKEKKNLNWKFLHYGNQPGIIKNYKVKSFPTYFLVGPEGKLIWSPAPSPQEDLHDRLFRLFRRKGLI